MPIIYSQELNLPYMIELRRDDRAEDSVLYTRDIWAKDEEAAIALGRMVQAGYIVCMQPRYGVILAVSDNEEGDSFHYSCVDYKE